MHKQQDFIKIIGPKKVMHQEGNVNRSEKKKRKLLWFCRLKPLFAANEGTRRLNAQIPRPSFTLLMDIKLHQLFLQSSKRHG